MSTDASRASNEQFLREYVAYYNRDDMIRPSYMTEGSFRTAKPLSVAERTRIQDLKEKHRLAIRECYGNAALLACETADDDEPLTYVEGLAVPPEGGFVVKHSWVELHEKVVEVAWPEGVDPHPATVYYGIEVPVDLVRKHRAGEYIIPITHPRNPAYKELSKSSRTHKHREPR